jgi:hypothetical protein
MLGVQNIPPGISRYANLKSCLLQSQVMFTELASEISSYVGSQSLPIGISHEESHVMSVYTLCQEGFDAVQSYRACQLESHGRQSCTFCELEAHGKDGWRGCQLVNVELQSLSLATDGQ